MHRFIKKIIFLILFPLLLYAQQSGIKFECLSLQDGLSQSTIRCIFQDTRGFIWIGTQDGLNRYDGYQFKIYKHDPHDSTSVSSSIIYSICEDQQCNLWIGTDGGGLNKFDIETETFIHYKNDPQNPHSLSFNRISSVCIDHLGILWIGTFGGGVNEMQLPFDGDSLPKFTHFSCQPEDSIGLVHYNVLAVYEDRNGVVWVGTDSSGLCKFDRKTEAFTNYRLSKYNIAISSIFDGKSGVLWIGTYGGGFYKFDPCTETLKHYENDPQNPNSLSHNQVYSIIEDRDGMVWIGTRYGGLNKFHPQKEKFTHYQNNPANPNSLSHNYINEIYEDRSGVIWIGTFGGGVNKFYPQQNKFRHYKKEPGAQNTLSHNFVVSIYEDTHSNLWIGTYGGGLNKLVRNEDSQIYTSYKNDPVNPNSLCGNVVRAIYEDKSGGLWIGAWQSGLDYFTPLLDRNKNGQIIHYKHIPGNQNSLINNAVMCVHERKNGEIWVGTENGGLHQFNPQAKSFKRYFNDPNNPKSLSDNSVYCILEDQSEVLWLGTCGGLNKFDRENEEFKYYNHEPGNPSSLSHDHVRSIHQGQQSNILWIGTSNGLNKFDPSKEIFIRYGENDGLPDGLIHGILEDNDRNLWLSTHKGLSRFDPKTETFRNYDASDGLQRNEFNGGAYFKSPRTGEMFFGGVNGFNSFFPENIKDNPYIPQMAITDFQLSNKSIPTCTLPLTKSITETKEIILSHEDHVFSFEFTALHFACPHKNQYAYKMDGLDKDWNYIGTRRFTTFTNLSPGEYVFRVKGSNCDGIWNEEGRSIKIIVTPPWWKTWWAYLIYFILFSGITFSIIRFSINRSLLKGELALKQEHAEKLEDLDRMKSRFFANISHEFRTPLTLILGPLEKLLSETIDKRLVKQYRVMLRSGRRLLRLINQLLDHSKMESGSMSLKASPENIVKLIRSTVLFFSSMAERRKIELKFSASQDSIEAYVDRDKLEKIMSNLLSNAFKFTPEGGKIYVTVSMANDESISQPYPIKWSKNWNKDFVEIVVADTGTGIPPDRIDKIFDRFFQVEDASTRTHEGTGIGLALTKELVEIHHGEICVESQISDEPDAQGTTFFIRLPLGKAHLKDQEIVEISHISSVDEKTSFELEKPEFEEISQITPEIHLKKGAEIILIVEDNQDVRDYIREFLETSYQIIDAKDGLEGFEIATEKIPDLIVSDVMMPRMDGFEFCSKIKTDERTSHIPVILLTARASGDSKVEGLETGADDYLTKPFDVRELQVRIKNLIEGRRKLRERFSHEITLQPKDVAITSMDQQFLQRAMDIVEKHIADAEFTTDTLAWEVGLSRMQLNRKLQALTDQPSCGFIRMLRLKRAAQLLQQSAGTVTEIAYDVGFNSLSHFAKAFREQFGQSPSEYAARYAHEE
jgi:signal transduction histidine kinase/ligand-binding sensor domain-containing protein/DNA-binding response OmpR family regulator